MFGFTGLAVAVGIPPFLQIVTRLPIFSTGHNSRLIPWYMIALALLAAWGFDDLRSGRLESERPRRLALLLGIPLVIPVVFVLARDEIHHISAHAVLVATGLVHPPADPDPTTTSMIHLASLLAWFVFGGAAAALIVLAARRRLRGTTLIAVAAGLIVLDLFRAGMGYNPAVAQADARQPATGAIRYLEAHRDTRFEATQDIAWNVIAMRYHLQEAGGYDIPIPSRFDRLWRREVDPEHPSQVGTTFSDIPLILPNGRRAPAADASPARRRQPARRPQRSAASSPRRPSGLQRSRRPRLFGRRCPTASGGRVRPAERPERR